MTFLRAMGWGLLGGAGGFLLGAIVASVIAAAANMPSREGGPGFFAVGIGLLTGLLGAITAVVYAFRSSGVPMSRVGVGALAVVATIGIAMGSYFFFYRQSQAYFRKTYYAAQVEVEFQGPAAQLRFEIVEGEDNATPGEWTGAGALRGQSKIFNVGSKRSLVLHLADGSTRTFRLPLARWPLAKRNFEWSPWVESGEFKVRCRVVERS